jgi:hypothetical protein
MRKLSICCCLVTRMQGKIMTKIADKSFKNVTQFTYFGTTVTDQHLIQDEIKRRLNSCKVCYHSVPNLLSSRLLSKNVKIRIYKSIILLWLCVGLKLGL